MPITSSNAILNQYVPPFCVNKPVEGDIFAYDASKQTWKNTPLSIDTLGLLSPESLIWEGTFGPGDVVTISDDLQTFVSVSRAEFGGGGGGATRLNDLSDVIILGATDRQFFAFDAELLVWNNVDISTSDISDFNSNDFATSAQGKLADSAIQTNDNVSDLANDVGYLIVIPETYLQVGDNVSTLVNDIGYLTASTMPGNTVTSVDARIGDVVLTDVYAGIIHTHLETDITDLDKYTKAEVDAAVQTSSPNEVYKSVIASIDLANDDSRFIGTDTIPANATVLRVKVQVVTPDSTSKLVIGNTTDNAAYMTDLENDPAEAGTYIAELFNTDATAVQLSYTVTDSTGDAGAFAQVSVEYRVPVTGAVVV